MTEWQRMKMLRDQLNVAEAKIRKLEDDSYYREAEFRALENERDELRDELAEARARHPSAARRTRDV